ncbi:hypothetical protein O1611_g1992 [Lasiodiplodia mahajangana]|uniref:Uncharacterized protein n=1 Tax=Lasiodiplodia mahajangana TaxID=1108764 RepID=A0ACC2JWQ1_9PEZI|nr:hypothetical protein O1611_g1992 [Lasiodiplodia mahajangana]
MTSKFNCHYQGEGCDLKPEEDSIFSTLGNDETFEEEPQPTSMKTGLRSHQKRALTFLLGREKGWDLCGSRRDIWRSYIDQFDRMRYQNTLSGYSQGERPPDFRGGILADDMGLGKTVTMLALIGLTLSLERCGCQATPTKTMQSPFTRGTLVVVPLSLLVVWEEQIKEHMSPEIRTLVYYGPDRTKNPYELSQYDIIITTYNVVCSEWKVGKRNPQRRKQKCLSFYTWHRIVLDEAHMIREKSTLNARAVCALHAVHRWCITGTPLQNRVADISSLLLFLRAYPYNDAKTFASDIIEPWRKGVDEKPLQRLQALMKILALHRPKSMIDLPPRIERVVEVKFDAMELKVYENARVGTIRVIDEAISKGSEVGSAYLSAFQRITDLRLICNHGMRYLALPKGKLSSRPEIEEMSVSGLEQEIEYLLDPSNQACRSCGTDISEELEDPNGVLLSQKDDAPGLCISCQNKRTETVSVTATAPFSPDFETAKATGVTHELPSKIKAVVRHVQAVPQNEKCVIFSYWTSTLNILEQGLDVAGIIYCRYDGRLRYSQRTDVLERFQKDASIKVILISITCGGQGLNLTAANHAILVEPQWNPMLEEQAISRVHRMRQQKAQAEAETDPLGLDPPKGYAEDRRRWKETATMYEFRFQVPNPSRHFKSAKIVLEFADARPGAHFTLDPVVHKIVPDGSFALNKAEKRSAVTKRFSGALGSGLDGLVEASLGFEWEVSAETTEEHYTSLSGIPGNERKDDFGEDNAAIWWLAEDLLKSVDVA